MNLSNISDNNYKLCNNIPNKNTYNVQKEEKDNREYFKKLFQISEYFYFFLKENKQNLIKIKDNEISDESNISKNEKFSQNTSMQDYNTVIRKADSNLLTKDNSKSFSINMIDKDNMAYLWYMEAKKRNNKTLNYKLGNDYDGLFNDCI